MKNKVIYLSALILMVFGFSAYAACGDSVCGYEGSAYVCYVENSTGGLQRCTTSSPCNINCMMN
jgi:hypothetical protein